MTAQSRTTKTIQPSLKLQPYPPCLPRSEDELKRAVCLLGNRSKAELKSLGHQELVALVGSYPSAEEAATWKQYLKQILKQK